MNKKILLVSYCILAFIGFSAIAQQNVLLPNDTASVPMVAEAPLFTNYNFLYKNRLDSIERAVPLPYNEYVQKYIEIYSGRKEMMGKMLGLGDYYFPIFEKALKSHQIPEEIKYLPIIESSMNPHAVSRVGATGLWQFMFGTAKGYGLNMDTYIDERKDPIQASYAAAAYFRDAYEQLGDWLLAIAAYNCGMGSVKRAVAKAGSSDFWEVRRFLPLETRNYVPAFIAAVYVMKYSGKHQITPQRISYSRITDTIQVNKFVSIPVLAKALNMDEEDLCMLNPSYKKKIVNGTNGSPKRIIVPKVSLADFAQIYHVLNAEAEPELKFASNDVPELKNPVPAPKELFFYHKVAPGQSLGIIANKYHVEVQDLKVWNKLKGSTIVPGQKLKVYSAEGVKEASGRFKT